MTNATELLAGLDPDAIRERLEEIEREACALRALLRAALARRRGQKPRPAESAAAHEVAPA